MPRRNRRKLHRELRLHAEKQSAKRAARRQADRLARASAEQAIARALRRKVLPPTVSPGTNALVAVALASMRNLMELAQVDRTTKAKVEQLVTALGETAPSLARCEMLPWFLLLARRPWHRMPGSWRAPKGSDRRKRDQLALHLLTAYPVPAFLVRALDVDPLPVARVPVEEEWAVKLLCWVGRGNSLRQAPADVLPTPMTRKMAHRFLQSTAATAPIAALRHAQVLAHGGPRPLSRRLLDTRLGVLRGGDPRTGEPFWDRVLAWLVGRPALWDVAPEELDKVLGWVEQAQRDAIDDGRELVLRGRPDGAVRAAAEAWWLRRQPPKGHFPPSGLQPLSWDHWHVVPLDSPASLREEGAAMSHCVASYVSLARKRRVSLWSIRRGTERRATVEVALPASTVVQAKGKANRAIGAEEHGVLRQWATINRLAVRLR